MSYHFLDSLSWLPVQQEKVKESSDSPNPHFQHLTHNYLSTHLFFSFHYFIILIKIYELLQRSISRKETLPLQSNSNWSIYIQIKRKKKKQKKEKSKCKYFCISAFTPTSWNIKWLILLIVLLPWQPSNTMPNYTTIIPFSTLSISIHNWSART